ncbi:C1 family peptidase [Thermococcus prieurii]
MNRKALSLLIVVAMVLAVVPAGLATTAVAPKVPVSIQSQHVLSVAEANPMPHGTGLKWISPSEYSKVTGIHFKPLTAKVFERAIENAPFYPGRGAPLPSSSVTSELTTLPSHVLNTMYLPPIGNQGYVGSCVAWSSTYYVWTYMLNWWRNNPFPSSPSDIMNPTFVYNLINGGADNGSYFGDAMNIISTIGAVPMNDFPLYVLGPYGDPSDYAWVWPNLTQWMIAPHNKANYYDYLAGEYGINIPGNWYIVDLSNATQWEYLKRLLAEGYVVQTGIMVYNNFFDYANASAIVNHLETYLEWTAPYISEYWENQSFANGTYVNKTVKYLLETAIEDYKAYAGSLSAQFNASIALFEKVLESYNISLNDTISVAYQKFEQGVKVKYIDNQSWWNNATFYMSTYSLKGTEWAFNHGYQDIWAIHNFELMVHHIPLGDYIKTSWGSPVSELNFYTYYQPGGHGVTIIGYDDNRETPDGKGAFVMVNSWGTDWGYRGYWYFSYDAAKGTPAVMTVDGVLQMPIFLGQGYAYVYVPKAAHYTPKLMAVVGINDTLRGETFDGIVVTNGSPYGPILSVPLNGGIAVGVIPGGSDYQFNITFFDLANNYLWIPYQWLPSNVNISNTTQVEIGVVELAEAVAAYYNISYAQALDLIGFPQTHPYPKSPMAFDITDDLDYLAQYIEDTNATPLNATFYIQLHDALPDGITGTLYNFTLLLNINGHYLPLAAIGENITIPDGKSIMVPVTVPLVKYENAPNNVSLNFGAFNVSIFSLIPLKGAEIIIGGKSYQLSAEEGGYYYYATNLAQKLNLHAGTYTYKVIVTYPNGKEVALPPRTVHIKGPLVYVISPEPTVYNTSLVPVKFKIVDDNNASVKEVTATLNGEKFNLTYNATTGLYTAELNLTNGKYTLTVTAVDEKNATGKATVNFVVSTEAKVKTVTVNNETNVTVGVVGGSANVTAENNTVVANVSTSKGTVTVEVPVVNNVQSVVVNASAINSVATGKSNASLAAGWNASVSVTTTAKYVKTENYKKLYSVTIRANVTLGENGVAVVALRDINISKIYVWKNGQKIQLTTDKSNPLGYYYKEGNIIFVVLKEDPVIEADGYFEVPVQVSRSHGVSLTALNFLAYRWYNMYLQEFNELYQKALQMNVSNETLKLALQYNETAATYYQKALELSNNNIILHLGDLQLLVPLRKAYLNEVKAVEILKEALEKLESQGS